MELSNDLLSQFAKITNDDKKEKKESTVYGTINIVDGEYYVRIDGSELLTPIERTTDLRVGDRATITIKDHKAIATGNISSPAVNIDDLSDAGFIQNSTILVKDSDLNITNSRIDAQNSSIEILNSAFTIENGVLTGLSSIITETLETTDLSAVNAEITNLKAKTAFITNVTAGSIQADFSQFDQVSARSLLAAAAIINNATIDGATVTELVGVTINGDLIQAGTLVADKILIRTENGLLYKINAEALGSEGLAEIEDLESLQNGLHGSIINDKTIVAEKIAVSDLVAFDATIAGFNIKKDTANDGLPGRLYSGAKGSISADATRGIYLDDSGQMNIGDASNYIKFYNDNGTYKLVIKADEIRLGSSGKTIETAITDTIENVQVGGRNLIKNSSTYAYSNVTRNNSGGYNDSPYYNFSEDLTSASSRAFINGDSDQISHIIPFSNKTLTLSIYIRNNTVNSVELQMRIVGKNDEGSLNIVNGVFDLDTDGKWHRYVFTSAVESISDENYSAGYPRFQIAVDTGENVDFDFCMLQLETGNKVTDWTPAPEDIDSDISSLDDDMSNVYNIMDSTSVDIDDTKNRLSNAEEGINILKEKISMLVVDVDSNGKEKSLLEQDKDGWTLLINDVVSGSEFREAMSAIKITTKNNQPYLELGSDQNDFRVGISNTSIDFMDGNTVPAKISNQSLTIGKAIIDDEMRIGNFILAERSNGNVGLTWGG